MTFWSFLLYLAGATALTAQLFRFMDYIEYPPRERHTDRS